MHSKRSSEQQKFSFVSFLPQHKGITFVSFRLKSNFQKTRLSVSQKTSNFTSFTVSSTITIRRNMITELLPRRVFVSKKGYHSVIPKFEFSFKILIFIENVHFASGNSVKREMKFYCLCTTEITFRQKKKIIYLFFYNEKAHESHLEMGGNHNSSITNKKLTKILFLLFKKKKKITQLDFLLYKLSQITERIVENGTPSILFEMLSIRLCIGI